MRITFELIGGPLNGIYNGELGKSSTVLKWFNASNSGQIGQDFVAECPSPNRPFPRHRYLVTSRVQQGQTIRIAAAHEGPA